jgi:mannitol/fructose-specific phosphotransferase system IIA component (Ntr-type)
MKDHLAFLASVSTLLQTKGFVEGLLKQPTPEQVLKYLRRLESER